MKTPPFSSSILRLSTQFKKGFGRSGHNSAGLAKRAFSLIEVALALGVVSFAMIGILGLLPVSLDIHRHSVQRQLALESLQQASVAIQSQFLDSATGKYSFNEWLTDSSTPISWKAGDAEKSYSMDLMADGNIRSAATPAAMPVVQKLHLQVTSPAAVTSSTLPNGPVIVKISVAWPAAAEWAGQGWQKSTGSLDAVCYALPY